MKAAFWSGADRRVEGRRCTLADRRVAALLLGTTSLLVLPLGGAAEAADPACAGVPLCNVQRGANGQNGEILFNWRTFGTAGSAAAPITQSNSGAIGGVANSAILLWSIGGKGGNGDYGVLRNVPGEPGGAGGSVTLTNSGAISGGSNHTTAVPLISLISQGGTGGNGFKAGDLGGLGAGGKGGDVTVNLTANVTASGTFTPALYMLSQGGDAGGGPNNARGGTEDYRMQTDAGGAGGLVSLTMSNKSTVSTSGANAPAIVLASFGGIGGTATANTSTYYASNGGAGGTVTFTNNGGTVTTSGANSSAVVLQSVGNKGGTGGGGAFTSAAPGGSGGDGGPVTAVNSGTITTGGAYGFGILAQSVGGSGGQGAKSAFASGGSGGATGFGGKVSITNNGTIKTAGAGATAILAQSIGGGNALDAFQATTPSANSGGGGAGGGAGLFGSGGAGGAGGPAGEVWVYQASTATISTTGAAANGVLAQSVGGGGGTGGVASSAFAFVAVALGGRGGGGGDGNTVTFQGDGGTITTTGANSTAILAQSIGGGGGTGGYAVAKSVGYGFSVASATGGAGGGGGKGGKVSVTSNTAVTTSGTQAMGIQATSIGGGGGTGGAANALAVALPAYTPSGKPLPSVAISNSIGGAGGDGGGADEAKITNTAKVVTYGTGSIGLISQSIGGGGGNAGNAMSYGLAIAAPGATAFNVTNAIGGSGGGGGAAGLAEVINKGTVITVGADAIGIMAESIGGGGGNSGSASASADALSLYRTITFGQTIGGTNDKGGGSGGRVHVSNDGTVQTAGEAAYGIFAQSIGGGGGNGGTVNASAASGLSFDKTLDGLVQKLPLADAVSIVNAIGGSGGVAGNGGKVEVETGNQAIIKTGGAMSVGIFAQSVGGGGGTGGGGSNASSGKTNIKLSFGGSGGKGGTGGTVTVSNGGIITTAGSGAHGIFAQSVGGGGGSGGSLTAAEDGTPDTVGEIWTVLKNAVGVGAYEAWAADKGNAETKEKLDAFIKDIQDSKTYKSLSDSFKNSDFYKQMQTFGGKITDYLDAQEKGAVKRPDVTLTLSIGGSGGSGGKGDKVTVTNQASGSIVTNGSVAYGILAQSVGGGGGQGGLAYSSGTSKTNLAGTIGGTGGDGGAGGIVEVYNRGAIRTFGGASYGVFAQSVGGGGGIGVGAASGDNENLVINLTLGRTGGGGGNGASVSVTNSNLISTAGDEAHGIVAQSIGGGGGAFVMNPETGKEDEAESDGKTSDSASDSTSDPATEEASESTITSLLKAVGIEKVPAASTDAEKPSAKSYGLIFSGAGGAAGKGGDVTVSHSGTIETSGEAAFGILAQSVGGGGGISNAAGSTGGVKYSGSKGGKGGSAGDGGVIYVTLGGSGASSPPAVITTSGDYSTAVVAQSIGGGGGYGGASVLQGFTLPVIGGTGGTSGDGGGIKIFTPYGRSNAVTINTTGTEAHGIFAQSLGGGGGMVSDLLKTDTTVRTTLTQVSTLIAKGGGKGTVLDNIDKVPESLQGVVRLFGDDADTVDSVVAKIKDALDNRSAAKGTGGYVQVDVNGSISATGEGSYGIFAQSGFQRLDGTLDPGRAGGNITITYTGMIKGGSGDGAAIVVDGGKANTITIGAGSNVSAVSGHAVIGTFGQESLANFGTLSGDIDLAYGGSNEFNQFRNEAGGTYISGGTGTINLGSRGWFYNAGTFDVGGVGTIATATVKNVDVQLGGALLVDVNSVAGAGQQNADLLKTARLTVDGVAIRPNAVEGLLPGSFTVISASSITTNQAATAGASPASPISWTASQSGNDIAISPSAAFVAKAGGDLTDTERSLLNSLQNAWDMKNASMAGTFADMANLTTADQYRLAINSLSVTEGQGQPAASQTLDTRRSLNSALSCPVFEGSSTMIGESQCVWARVTGSRMAQFDGGNAGGFTQNAMSYRLGGQWEFSPDWFLGATAAYTNSWLQTSDGLTSINGSGGDISVALKHQMGAWLFAGAVNVGYSSADSSSRFFVGEDQWQADVASDVWTAGVRLRAAYEFAFANWYIRPYADLDVLHTSMPGYSLSGDGATLRAGDMQAWTVAFEPAVEIGARVNLGDYGWLRPYATVGATFIGGSGLTQDVAFSDGGGQGINFTSTSNMPDRLLDLGAGLQFFTKDKYELRGEYKAQIADDFLNQEIGLRMAIRF